MRILFGGMLFYTHLVWGMNLEGFFGPNGWQSATLVRTVQQGQLAWSFWWWVPDGMRLPVHLICLGILLLFMVGAFTRVTSILAYVITVSYAYRAPLANYGLDQINGIAAFYLAIGPSSGPVGRPTVAEVSAGFERTPRGKVSARSAARLLVASRQPGPAADAGSSLCDLSLRVPLEVAGRELVERPGNLAGRLQLGVPVDRFDVAGLVSVAGEHLDAGTVCGR